MLMDWVGGRAHLGSTKSPGHHCRSSRHTLNDSPLFSLCGMSLYSAMQYHAADDVALPTLLFLSHTFALLNEYPLRVRHNLGHWDFTGVCRHFLILYPTPVFLSQGLAFFFSWRFSFFAPI